MSGPTDNERIWRALREAGSHGLHSFDIRTHLHSGNPSQRIRDLEQLHDCEIPRKREKWNGRMGIRYFLPTSNPDSGSPGAGGERPSPGLSRRRLEGSAPPSGGASPPGSAPADCAAVRSGEGEQPEGETAALFDLEQPTRSRPTLMDPDSEAA